MSWFLAPIILFVEVRIITGFINDKTAHTFDNIFSDSDKCNTVIETIDSNYGEFIIIGGSTTASTIIEPDVLTTSCKEQERAFIIKR